MSIVFVKSTPNLVDKSDNDCILALLESITDSAVAIAVSSSDPLVCLAVSPLDSWYSLEPLSARVLPLNSISRTALPYRPKSGAIA